MSARRIAYEAIQAYERRGIFVADTLSRLFTSENVAGADRRLATELACGTVRRRLTLDAILAAYCSRPLPELDLVVKLVLRLGLNQLLFADRIPTHAAVDESVGLCRELKQPAATGLINGVLRNIAREIETGAKSVQSLADCSGELIIRTIDGPAPPYEGVQFARPIAPNPRLKPAEYLSVVTSLPLWLVQHWLPHHSPDDILRMGMWFDTPGKVGVRVNLLRTTRDRALDALQKDGIVCLPGELPESIIPDRTFAVEDAPGFTDGWFTIQDESAMRVVDALKPQPGERILDLCAAPGGKSTHVAERMQDQGHVIACDIVPERLALVGQAAARLQLKSVELRNINSDGTKIPPGPYDAVLVDAPCSNTGVLGKRPEARWRLEQDSLSNLIPVQQQLLERAVDLVRPGGRVMYSTCSIEPEENQQVVRSVVSQYPGLELVDEVLSLPGVAGDGGYRALLRKSI